MTQAESAPSQNDTLYIVDRNLDLVYVNGEWVDFARSNHGEALLSASKPINLLDSMSGSAKSRWQSIYQLLLDGHLNSHEERFNCASPAERRTFRLRIEPEADDIGRVIRLVHRTVEIDEQADISLAVSRVEKMTEDPGVTRESYRRRIAERRIEIAGFDVSHRIRPLGKTGGDLLWHRGYANGSADVVIADVMGHGDPAGPRAVELSFLLDELVKVDDSPMRIIASVSSSLQRFAGWRDSVFATGILLRFDPRRELLTACNFGHECPIFSQSRRVFIATGPPVGLDFRLGNWPEVTLRFSEHGRRFLAFTDGIPEQFDEKGRMFTVDRIEELFFRNLDLRTAEMTEQIIQTVDTFRGQAITKDDQTLLAMECLK